MRKKYQHLTKGSESSFTVAEVGGAAAYLHRSSGESQMYFEQDTSPLQDKQARRLSHLPREGANRPLVIKLTCFGLREEARVPGETM